jgi:hypothetical protein
MGWKGKRDRDLLDLAKGRFEILLTGDGFFDQEHDLASYGLAAIVLRAVEALVPKIATAIDQIEAGDTVVLSA